MCAILANHSATFNQRVSIITLIVHRWILTISSKINDVLLCEDENNMTIWKKINHYTFRRLNFSKRSKNYYNNCMIWTHAHFEYLYYYYSCTVDGITFRHGVRNNAVPPMRLLMRLSTTSIRTRDGMDRIYCCYHFYIINFGRKIPTQASISIENIDWKWRIHTEAYWPSCYTL